MPVSVHFIADFPFFSRPWQISSTSRFASLKLKKLCFTLLFPSARQMGNDTKFMVSLSQTPLVKKSFLWYNKHRNSNKKEI